MSSRVMMVAAAAACALVLAAAVPASALPKSVDWRARGKVTPVANQGQCGSSWVFGAVGAIESAYAIGTGTLVPLSVQQVVDCIGGYSGCNGGFPQQAYEYVQKHGLCSAADYPTTGSQGQCEASKCTATVPPGWLKGKGGCMNVTSDSVEDMKAALVKGPVSTAADAESWQMYTGGVFDGQCGTQLDHGVLIVGYDETTDGETYFMVKNSWGASWGESGYINIGVPHGKDECGILEDGQRPTGPDGM